MRRTSIYKTFRVYLNWRGRPRGRFYKVNVFKSLRSMYDYSLSVGHTIGKGFDARNFRFMVGHHGKRGVVMFYRGRTQPDVVAHEMLHVALDQTPKNRRKVFTCIPDQERVCYLHDSLVKQFYKRYKKG